MPQQRSVSAARNDLPALVHEVERGTSVEITRRGRPVAVLVSLAEYRRLTSAGPDLWAAIEEFRRVHDLAGLDADEVYGDVRDPSPGREVAL